MRIKFTVIVLILIVLVSACAPKEDTPIPEEPIIKEPVVGGEVRIGTDLSNFKHDPIGYTPSQSAIYNIDTILYRGLAKYNEQLQLTPDIASSINIDEENKKIELQLKNNVKFSDGTPLTVDDVIYTVNFYSSGVYNGKWKDYTYNIQGTDQYRREKSETISGIVIEENKITLSYNKLSANDLQLLTAPILSKNQLSGKSVNEVKELASSGKLLATGPYKIETESSSEWVLTRNGFYEEKVYLDKIRFLPYTETNTYDLVFSQPVLTENLEEGKEILTVPGQGYQYLGINLAVEELQDISTRKAIALGLDYQYILDKLYLGYADRVSSPLQPASWAYVGGTPHETNLEEARNLLAGKELALSLAYEDTPFYNEMATQIANRLNEIGIKLKLVPINKEEYISKLFYKGEYDLFIASWQYEIDPVYENEKWLARNDVLQGGYNVSHVNDTKSDELLLKGLQSLDTAERKTVYEEWQSYFMEQYYYIPLASPQLVLVKSDKLNLEINNSLVPYYNIQSWWVSQ